VSGGTLNLTHSFTYIAIANVIILPAFGVYDQELYAGPTWHLSGGPVGSPARWAAASNVVRGSGTRRGSMGPLARERWL